MIRHLARLMMSGIFIAGGADALRNPGPKVDMADGVAQPIAREIPGVPADDVENLIRINGAAQVIGGGLMALNIMPRTSAAGLAATLVPTTLAAHPFWEAEGPERKAQTIQFLKNAALFGGLVLTALDTQGKPGVGWRAGHLVDQAAHEAEFRRREAELLAQIARYRAAAALSDTKHKTSAALTDAKHQTALAVADTKAKTIVPARQAAKDAKLAATVAHRTGRVVSKVAGGTASGVGATLKGAGKAVKGVGTVVGRTALGVGSGLQAAVVSMRS